MARIDDMIEESEHPYLGAEFGRRYVDPSTATNARQAGEYVASNEAFWQRQDAQEETARRTATLVEEQMAVKYGNMAAAEYEYDVFVSHANDNKQAFVDSLSAGLNRLGIKVWYDSSVLDWGDDWKAKIEEGLAKSRFGIVVLSPQFIDREWTTKELQELLNRQNERHEKVVLPLLYNLTVDDMKAKYPDLAPIQARVIREDEDAKDVVIDFARILIRALKNG
ncbi:MAG: toll/interleukin-1 receptor domain-containing protein [Kiritimatiellae bacterium]|nr:toll/interleukin-1 receptor domain-containing protein [Kiritimatiellia bacterium]